MPPRTIERTSRRLLVGVPTLAGRPDQLALRGETRSVISIFLGSATDGNVRLELGDLGAAGQGTEVFGDQLLGLNRVEIAGDAGAGVVRAVVGAEEVRDVVEAGRRGSAIEPITLW